MKQITQDDLKQIIKYLGDSGDLEGLEKLNSLMLLLLNELTAGFINPFNNILIKEYYDGSEPILMGRKIPIKYNYDIMDYDTFSKSCIDGNYIDENYKSVEFSIELHTEDKFTTDYNLEIYDNYESVINITNDKYKYKINENEYLYDIGKGQRNFLTYMLLKDNRYEYNFYLYRIFDNIYQGELDKNYSISIKNGDVFFSSNSEENNEKPYNKRRHERIIHFYMDRLKGYKKGLVKEPYHNGYSYSFYTVIIMMILVVLCFCMFFKFG